MKRTKRASQKRSSSVKTPVARLGKEDTIAHYNAVLIEDLKSGMKQVIEGVEHTRVVLTEKIDSSEQRLSRRLEAVEFAVTKHSGEIKDLRTEMHEMEGRLSAKIDGHAARLDDHETRITTLETTNL
ncbi:MAG: hypothetical protein V2A66_06125 [Pseudomonadota bacterium]